MKKICLDLRCIVEERIVDQQENSMKTPIQIHFNEEDRAKYTAGLSATVTEAYNWLNKVVRCIYTVNLIIFIKNLTIRNGLIIAFFQSHLRSLET